MFAKTKVSKAVLLALGSSLAMGAALAQTSEPQRVEVTGSAIKRTDSEGVAPVEIVTRKDIQKTGAASLNELIRSIPSIDVFDQGELASNSPSGSGTASLALRGLSSSNLLVLLNGRRVPVNALYDSSGAGAAFDINTIPVSAVERIEILKDGGSAIYGADAVAGVINIITKTDYQGIEASAGFGVSSENDGKETRLGLSAGFGNLQADRFNVLIGLDYFKRDPILRKDRDISSSVNFTRFGGPDRRSTFSPFGNILDPNAGFAFAPNISYRPCPAENFDPLSGLCRYDFNASLLTSYNAADRISALAAANFLVTPDVKLFAELTFSKSKDTFKAHPVPDFFVVPLIDESQRPYVLPIEFGFGPDKLYIAGRFMQGGPRTTNRESTLLSTVVGADATAFGMDWKVSLGRGESKVTNSDSNYYDANLWFPATSGGLLDPTSNTNDPAFVESLKVNPVREGKSVLTQFNVVGSGELMQLPAGPLGFAVGATYINETLSDQPDALTQQGLVVGSIAQSAVDAERSNKAVFAELAIPITKTLEAQAAVRWDKYPSESATSPKFGLKWSATPDFTVRGSATRSFRAPVLKQLFGGQEQGATTVTDPALCQIITGAPTPPATCTINAFQVNGSNPDLKSETGTTLNLGFVLDVSKTFSASVDLWRIKKSDDISTPTLESAIRDGRFEVDGARTLIFTNLQNIADRVTQGVDVDARVRLPGLSIGNLTIRNLFTYYDSIRSRSASGDAYTEFVGTYAQPRFRNAFIASLENGPWTFTGNLRTTGGFYDEDDPTTIAAGGVRRVGSHEELDVQAQYAGFAGLTLTGGIKNIFDRMPPLSIQNASSNSYTQMGFAELYTARGRFFYVNANYAFR